MAVHAMRPSPLLGPAHQARSSTNLTIGAPRLFRTAEVAEVAEAPRRRCRAMQTLASSVRFRSVGSIRSTNSFGWPERLSRGAGMNEVNTEDTKVTKMNGDLPRPEHGSNHMP